MANEQPFRVALDQIVPIKTAARTLPTQIARLQSGDPAQLVITRHNEPLAVLLSWREFNRMNGTTE